METCKRPSWRAFRSTRPTSSVTTSCTTHVWRATWTSQATHTPQPHPLLHQPIYCPIHASSHCLPRFQIQQIFHMLSENECQKSSRKTFLLKLCMAGGENACRKQRRYRHGISKPSKYPPTSLGCTPVLACIQITTKHARARAHTHTHTLTVTLTALLRFDVIHGTAQKTDRLLVTADRCLARVDRRLVCTDRPLGGTGRRLDSTDGHLASTDTRLPSRDTRVVTTDRLYVPQTADKQHRQRFN